MKNTVWKSIGITFLVEDSKKGQKFTFNDVIVVFLVMSPYSIE